MGKSPADQFCSGSLASTQTGRSPNVFVSENVAAINDSITLSGFLLLIRKVLVEQKKLRLIRLYRSGFVSNWKADDLISSSAVECPEKKGESHHRILLYNRIDYLTQILLFYLELSNKNSAE